MPRRIFACILVVLIVVSIGWYGREYTVIAQEKVDESQDGDRFVLDKYSAEIDRARTEVKRLFKQGLAVDGELKQVLPVARPPGISVAVSVGGILVWAEGFGFGDLEQGVRVSRHTKFRLGSTSKPLTAVGVLLLHQRSQLDLDVSVQRYVPSFPDKGQVITTRQLLAHLSGIRHYNEKESKNENQQHYGSVSEALAKFKDDPLVAPPGSKFIYSSYGYTLLSAVVEGATGQKFLSFMHDQVFLPLGMEETVADENEKIIDHRARWYQINSDGTYRNSPYVDLSYKWAGGGFLSSAEDLARFGSALLQPGFLREDVLLLMFTRQRTNASRQTNYGLGWFVRDKGERVTERVFEHDGGTTGGMSWLVIFPDQRVVIAWLMNTDDVVIQDTDLRGIAAPFLDREKNSTPGVKSSVN
jgi:serine beta-lactamase-like protein LACTB, mitochondrial